MQRICINLECGWIGDESECVHPYHWPENRYCPECHDNTEELYKEPDMNMLQSSLKVRIAELQSEISRLESSNAPLDQRTDDARQHIALIWAHKDALKVYRAAIAQENAFVLQLSRSCNPHDLAYYDCQCKGENKNG